MVISSFGKGTSLNDEFRIEIEKIRNACPKTVFYLFDLPAFSRPKMTTDLLGKELSKSIS